MSWLSVYENCQDIMHFIRELLDWIALFLTDSEMYDKLSQGVGMSATVSIGDAIKATGLTLCVLFFLIDFFQKSLHLQWVTWENIIMFFMKLFVVKIVLNNVGGLMSMIQNGFSSIIKTAGLNTGLGMVIFPALGPDSDIGYFLEQGSEAYNRAKDSPGALWGDIDLMAGFYNIGITIMGLIMKIVFIIIAIIIIARIFELLVYTAIAPIPLATLSCDGLQDVGKGFLKSYAAVCLQAVVIVIMITVYGVLLSRNNRELLHLDQLGPQWISLLMTFIFGAGIMQSGNLAKKFCGAM